MSCSSFPSICFFIGQFDLFYSDSTTLKPVTLLGIVILSAVYEHNALRRSLPAQNYNCTGPPTVLICDEMRGSRLVQKAAPSKHCEVIAM